jgi:1-acyl-sn-glycerol-3-phosphate acyltransferase
MKVPQGRDWGKRRPPLAPPAPAVAYGGAGNRSVALLAFRSFLFNVVFYVNLIAFMLVGAPLALGPRIWAIRALQLWATTSLWWLKVIAGARYEVRGREHIPDGPALVAGKHQSFWETFAILPLLDDPAMVMKRELFFIPLFGWWAVKFRMIGVDRSAGPSALKRMIARAQAAISLGRQVVVFPEGTRRPPDAAPDYKPGAAALYMKLAVPCTPFALNSGLYWPRREAVRRPGTIVIEFLPPIPPGLDRKRFERSLIEAVEPATARLVAEARQAMSALS